VTDLKALKRDNSIQQVIIECGIPLVQDAGILRGQDDRSLEVDSELGRYSWGEKKGDVLDFLQKHFDWSFGQAVNYLRNRKPVLAGTAIGYAEPVGDQPAGQPGDGAYSWIQETDEERIKAALRDARVLEALRLGMDYPGGGMRRFVGARNYVFFFREAEWLPGEFWAASGLLTDPECALCNRDLSGWQQPGRAFRAVNLDNYDQVVRHEAAVYCECCVDKVRRWHRAFVLLATYAREVELREEKHFVVKGDGNETEFEHDVSGTR
jgi:hypothetical protein